MRASFSASRHRRVTFRALAHGRIEQKGQPVPTTNSPSTLKLIPMSRAQAAELVKRLLRSYASLPLHDPEGYVAEIVTLLTGYPLWAGESVIDDVRHTAKYLPNISDIHPKLEAAIRPLKYAVEWDAQSQRQLLEDKRNAGESPEHRAAVIDRIRKEMAANGMPIMGDKESDFDPRFTVSAVKEKLKITDEQWNQIPDADPGKWQRLQAQHQPERKGGDTGTG